MRATIHVCAAKLLGSLCALEKASIEVGGVAKNHTREIEWIFMLWYKVRI